MGRSMGPRTEELAVSGKRTAKLGKGLELRRWWKTQRKSLTCLAYSAGNQETPPKA